MSFFEMGFRFRRSEVGGRYYSIKNHGIFLSEKRTLFLMDTWFYLV